MTTEIKREFRITREEVKVLRDFVTECNKFKEVVENFDSYAFLEYVICGIDLSKTGIEVVIE